MTGVNTLGINSNLGFNGLNPINNTYDNDIMMPDFLKATQTMNYALPQTQIQTQPQPSQPSVFTGTQQTTPAPQITDEQIQQYIQSQAQAQNQQNKEEQPKTSFFKKFGAVVGGITPAIYGYINKSTSLKTLAIRCPLLGFAGFAIGTLIDGVVNSFSSNK